jgi:DNA-binding CsgD family transcriptional regulator
LGTKYDTVRTQITSIYRKCNVHSRSELMAKLKGRRPS